MTWQELGVNVLVTAPFSLAIFTLGWWLGRCSEVQRRMDAVLRRETRHRHPAGAQVSLQPQSGLLRLSDADRWFSATPEQRAEVLSQFREPPEVSPVTRLCGKPVRPVGDPGPVPCVLEADHDGLCW